MNISFFTPKNPNCIQVDFLLCFHQQRHRNHASKWRNTKNKNKHTQHPHLSLFSIMAFIHTHCWYHCNNHVSQQHGCDSSNHFKWHSGRAWPLNTQGRLGLQTLPFRLTKKAFKQLVFLCCKKMLKQGLSLSPECASATNNHSASKDRQHLKNKLQTNNKYKDK